jgi:hypothetical protein
MAQNRFQEKLRRTLAKSLLRALRFLRLNNFGLQSEGAIRRALLCDLCALCGYLSFFGRAELDSTYSADYFAGYKLAKKPLCSSPRTNELSI